MKKLIIPVLALVAGVASARSFDVRVWRGETTAVRAPDYAEFGETPEGISVRVGAMMPVAYQEKNDEKNVKVGLDRVDFGAKGGSRYVEVMAAADAKPGVYDIGNLRVTVVDRVLPPAKVIDDAKAAELEKLFNVKAALKGTDFLKVRNRLQSAVNL